MVGPGRRLGFAPDPWQAELLCGQDQQVIMLCARQTGKSTVAALTAHDCPRIAPEWLEAQRLAIGEWWYRQEYLCQFVESDDSLFLYDDVMAALSGDVEPLFPLQQA